MNDGMFQSDLAELMQPRILLKPESWLSKIDFINHLVLFNNILITVLSEKEGGKTSFATLLQENLDPQIKLLLITARAPCSREEIISDIATQFHLRLDENTDISSLVAQINERRSHVLLMIDDAQHLPETFIKEVMLAIKNQDNFNFFHLCLLSDYSIVAALNGFSASIFDDLVHNIELGSLTESEARTYTLQRAMNTRLINKPLSEAQFKQFYQLTKGNVAKINANLESFIFNSSNKKKNNAVDAVKKWGIPVGTAVLSGVTCLCIATYFNEPSATAVTATSQPQKEVMAAVAQPEILVSKIAGWQDSATRHLVEHSLARKQNLDIISKGLAGEVVAIADKAVVHAKRKVRAKVLVKAPSTKEEKLYTIQLVASPYKIDMARYKINNKIFDNSARLNHYREKNKETWYVLTMGEFSTIGEAQQTIDKLPPSLMKLNPWVRPISTLG